MDVIRAALQTIWRSDRHHEVLKTRLDAVGQPYAIGTRKMTGGCADVLVKTSLSQIESCMPTFAYMLSHSWNSSDSYNLLVHGADSYNAFSSVYTNLPSSFCAVRDTTGAYAYCLDLSQAEAYEDSPTFSEYAAGVCTQDSPRLFFCIDGLPLLSAAPEDIVDNKKIIFRHRYGKETIPIGEGDEWILKLISKIVLDDGLPVQLTPERISYSSKNAEAQAYVRSPYYSDQREISNAVSAAVPTASVSFPNAGEIQILLNIDVNEGLSSAALEQIEAIYDASGFEKSRFTKLLFLLVSENDDEFERARVWLQKENGSIRWYHYFKNGRLEKYKLQFEEALSNSDFFSGGEFLTS